MRWLPALGLALAGGTLAVALGAPAVVVQVALIAGWCLGALTTVRAAR